MSKHTPGPWFADLGASHEKWLVSSAGGEVEICQDRGWGDEYEDEDYANARLIAAAPELLEALCELLDNGPIRACRAADNVKAKARAVIAKARGENNNE